MVLQMNSFSMNSDSSSFLRSFLFVILTPVFAQTTQTYLFTLCKPTSAVNTTTGGSSVVNATTGGCGLVTNDDISDCMYSGPIRADGICTCDSVYERCIRLSIGGIIDTLNVTIYRYGRNQNNCEGTLLISHKNVPIDNVCRRVSGSVVNGSLTNSSFISVLVTNTQDYLYKKCSVSDFDYYDVPKSSCGSLAYCATNPSSLFWVSGTGEHGNCNFNNCFGFLCRSKTSTSKYGASDHNAVGMCLYCAPPNGWGEAGGNYSGPGYDSFGMLLFVRYILPLLIIPFIYVCILVCRRFGFDCCPNVSPRVCVQRRKRARGNQPALNQPTMNIPANIGFPINIDPYAAENPHTVSNSQHRLNDPGTVSSLNPVSNSESEKLKRIAQLRRNLSYF